MQIIHYSILLKFYSVCDAWTSTMMLNRTKCICLLFNTHLNPIQVVTSEQVRDGLVWLTFIRFSKRSLHLFDRVHGRRRWCCIVAFNCSIFNTYSSSTQIVTSELLVEYARRALVLFSIRFLCSILMMDGCNIAWIGSCGLLGWRCIVTCICSILNTYSAPLKLWHVNQ